MNRTFVAVCGAMVMSAALLAAQDKPASDNHSGNGNHNGASANAVTFTGCLTPGSGGESFYLTSAKQKGVKNSDKSLKIVAATPKVKLGPLVTQEVEVSGTIDDVTAAAATDTDAASKLRTLTVTKIKLRNQYCG